MGTIECHWHVEGRRVHGIPCSVYASRRSRLLEQFNNPDSDQRSINMGVEQQENGDDGVNNHSVGYLSIDSRGLARSLKATEPDTRAARLYTTISVVSISLFYSILSACIIATPFLLLSIQKSVDTADKRITQSNVQLKEVHTKIIADMNRRFDNEVLKMYNDKQYLEAAAKSIQKKDN